MEVTITANVFLLSRFNYNGRNYTQRGIQGPSSDPPFFTQKTLDGFNSGFRLYLLPIGLNIMDQQGEGESMDEGT
jgi:hypothetical protein